MSAAVTTTPKNNRHSGARRNKNNRHSGASRNLAAVFILDGIPA
jgi:hypothetical protein